MTVAGIELLYVLFGSVVVAWLYYSGVVLFLLIRESNPETIRESVAIGLNSFGQSLLLGQWLMLVKIGSVLRR